MVPGVNHLMKFLKGFLMAVGGLTLVVIIAALLFSRGGNQQLTSSNSNEAGNSGTASSPVPQQSVAPSTPANTSTELSPTEAQRKDLTTEATLLYWKRWKSALESYKVAVEPLGEYSIDNSIALSSLNTQLADQLVQLSAVNVDPELIEVATNAIAMYKSRARLFQEQANILSKWNAFVKKRDSDATTGAGIIVFLFNEKDRFAVPKALAEEANQIKSEWNNNLALINKQNQNIEVVIANREVMKTKLESKYGINFEKF